MYRPLSLTPEEDYTAGEVDRPERWEPRRAMEGKVDGAQIHFLSYLGETWGKGAKPRFTAEEVAAQSRRVAAAGGVITWDVPARPDGTIASEFLAQLQAVHEALVPPAQ
jgi:hypothetical protein